MSGPQSETTLAPHRKWPLVLAASAIWLVAWQVVAMVVNQAIVVASPIQVVVALWGLVTKASFWGTAWTTFWHIGTGFVLAICLGTLLAWVATLHRFADALLAPPIRAMRSVPVVSFIILLLIWGGSAWLSTIVSCLMVLPVAFDNIGVGLREAPVELRQMTHVFKVPPWRAFRAVTVPAVLPFLIAACRVGVGLAWKSGISAEVIGLPAGTIGDRLNMAKLYLATGDLFAWTVVIVVLGLGTEKLVLWLLDRAGHRLQGDAQ